MAALQQTHGSSPLLVHSFFTPAVTVGRHEECDVILDSPAVSRYHVKIYRDSNRYFIEDLNSRNGTSVNGQPIRSRTVLNDGDQVSISTLQYRFLSHDLLTEASGSWGNKPDVVSLSHSSDELAEESMRRIVIGQGDCISNEQLGTDPIRPNQVLGRIQVADGGSAWPVVNNPTFKLNQMLRLLHSLRQTTRRDDVVSRTLETLFEMFPATEHIAFLTRNQQGTGIEVAAAVSRQPADEVRICLPVVRTAMQNSEALLYAEHWNGRDSAQPSASMSEILVAPLMGLSGHSIGAIQMHSSHNHRDLTCDELEQLVVLCQVVSFTYEQVQATAAYVTQAVLERTMADADRLQTLTHGPRDSGIETIDESSLHSTQPQASDE